MTDNALKIIKDELERINEARAKATPLYYTKHQKMKHFTDYLIGVDCCQEEPFVIADMNRNMDNWKHDLEFIDMAANEITNLTKALSVAVENLKKYSHEQYHGFVAREALTTIANILSGGKDGK